MSCSLTGQANGTIRYRIPQGNDLKVPQSNDLKVTFIPEGNYCVERWNEKFAVFLPVANDDSSNDGSGNDGSGNDGPGNDGPGNDGPGNDGPSNDGPSNDGPSNDDSSSGFCIKLEDHGGVELKLKKGGPEESKRALLYAATHGTKVTVEVTKKDQKKLTLKAVTIPAE